MSLATPSYCQRQKKEDLFMSDLLIRELNSNAHIEQAMDFVKERTFLYLDRQLNVEEKKLFESLINNCSKCSKYFHQKSTERQELINKIPYGLISQEMFQDVKSEIYELVDSLKPEIERPKSWFQKTLSLINR